MYMMGNADSRSLDHGSNRYDSRGGGLELQRKPSVPVPRLPMPDGVELERRFTKVLVSKEEFSSITIPNCIENRSIVHFLWRLKSLALSNLDYYR